MASAFSSNDEEVLNRSNSVEEKDLVKTHSENLHEVYEIDKCISFIKANNFQNVSLQFPDELLVDAVKVTKILIAETTAKVFLLADTSYGSYDIDEVAAQHVQADLIIHYGKSSLTSSTCTRTMFMFGRKPLSRNAVSNSFYSSFPDVNSKVVFLLQPQWYYTADYFEHHFKAKYSNFIMAKLTTPFQPSSDEEDCHNSCPDCTCGKESKINSLYNHLKNTFKFHRLGIYELDTPEEFSLDEYSLFYVGSDKSESLRNIFFNHPGNSVIVFNPLTSTCSKLNVSINKTLMKRLFLVEQMKDAKTVGILVGTMGMAGFCDIISHLKKILSACGKKTYTINVGKLNPNKLANFPEIDAFVLVSCPEESLVDSKEYFKPICTPYDVELACNANRKFEGIYPLDFRQLLPGGEYHVTFEPVTTNDVSLITGNVRHNEEVMDVSTSDIEVRSMNSSLSVFHPNSAAHRFSSRSWNGLEQKLGETPVELVQEGRSGLPMKYTYNS